MTLKRSLKISLTKGFLLFAVIFAWYAPHAILGTGFAALESGTSDQVMEIRPHAEGSPAELIEQNDCWTGEAPADVEVPGHVVISTVKGARIAGPRFVNMALEQIFEGTDHNLVVHGFCR